MPASTASTEQFEVRNRWTGEVQFTATISVTPDMTPAVKLGLAVRWGVKNNADLAGAYLARADLAGAYLAGAYLADAYLARANLADANLADANLARANLADAYLADANLAGADLARADLAGAYLADANLAGADLARADLAGADLARAKNLTDDQLRPIIADYWMILTRAQREVPALIAALRAGRVDGSTYDGACACLVGSLENAGASGLPHEPGSPAERWFAAIGNGDKPGDDSAGGFASSKALQWALEYCEHAGIAVEAQP